MNTRWLEIMALVAVILMMLFVVVTGSNMPIVQLNPDGRCVAVLPSGSCGMLPDRYTTERVSYDYIAKQATGGKL